MSLLGRIRKWLKYERLGHYPALAAFDQELALKRLRAYEREEREACQPWLTISAILLAVLFLLWSVLFFYSPRWQFMGIYIQIPVWALQYTLHRRIRRRVEAKVAAELRNGRFWTCFECGYDLRASPERCPECGTPVHVLPPR